MDNCTHSTKVLLNLLQIKFTKGFVEEYVLSHPDHPSLLCISDTLGKYGVESLAVKVNAKKLSQFPLPCIIQLSDSGGIFHVLTEFAENRVVYLNVTGKPVELSKEEFIKRWTGICLLAETMGGAGEPGLPKRLRQKRNIATLTWCTIVLLLIAMLSILSRSPLMTGSTAFFLSTYTILKLIGLTIGAILLWFEVDEYNPTLLSFCSGGNKVDCNAVLSSKYAQLFNGSLSLSLIGFSYFFGSLAFLAIEGFSAPAMAFLSFLSFAILPAVIVSLYYQAVVIKQWCRFCIMVQVVLTIEVAVILFGKFYVSSIEWETLPLFLGLFLLPVAVWKLVKPLLDIKKEGDLHRRGLKRIKNNSNVFESLLERSRKIIHNTQDLGISFKNGQAKYNVIKVCNPYCGPCAAAHSLLEELVRKGKINLQILYTAKVESDFMAKPIRHFLAIDSQGNMKETQNALDDWYGSEKKDYSLFADKYPLNEELKEQDEKIKKMSAWCEAEMITHTPTIFINGYELPREYRLEDLLEVIK